MLLSALKVSLAIVFFRAGPQDMPFDQSPRLLQQTVLFAVACYTVLLGLASPLPAALVIAAVTVLAQGISTRLTVAARKMENRFQQTFTALLLTNAILAAVMLPAMMSLAPALMEMSKALQAHPELASTPDKLPPLPFGPFLTMLVLGIWQFVVSVRIFGRAVEVGLPGAILIALLVGLGVTFFVELVGQGLAVLAG